LSRHLQQYLPSGSGRPGPAAVAQAPDSSILKHSCKAPSLGIHRIDPVGVRSRATEGIRKNDGRRVTPGPLCYMEETDSEDLRKVYRKEKDPRVMKRMAAVNAVCVLDYRISDAAELLMQCPNWVSHWMRRFEEGSIDSLRNLPRSGRPPKVRREMIQDNQKEQGRQDHPAQAARGHTREYGRPVPHNVGQADHEDTRHVAQGIATGSHKQAGHGDHTQVAGQRKKADLAPETAGFCHRYNGRIDLRQHHIQGTLCPGRNL